MIYIWGSYTAALSLAYAIADGIQMIPLEPLVKYLFRNPQTSSVVGNKDSKVLTTISHSCS